KEEQKKVWKTATDTNHKELPKSRRHKERPFRAREPSEKTDGKRTTNVHDKRTERKKFTCAFSNESRQPEARPGPECAAEHYENITEHKKILPAWKESSAHAVFRPKVFRSRRQTPLPCAHSSAIAGPVEQSRKHFPLSIGKTNRDSSNSIEMTGYILNLSPK